MKQQYCSTFNDKYKIPSPEDIVINKIYSFTINPLKQHGGQMLGYMHHDSDIVRLLKHKDIKYELHRELSSKGRIHYHGYIQFIDKRSLLEIYLILIPKWMRLSTFYIDTIDEKDNGESWSLYCNKQKEIWDLNDIPSVIHNDIVHPSLSLKKKNKNNNIIVNKSELGIVKTAPTSDRSNDSDR